MQISYLELFYKIKAYSNKDLNFKFITSMTGCQSGYSPRTPTGERTDRTRRTKQ